MTTTLNGVTDGIKMLERGECYYNDHISTEIKIPTNKVYFEDGVFIDGRVFDCYTFFKCEGIVEYHHTQEIIDDNECVLTNYEIIKLSDAKERTRSLYEVIYKDISSFIGGEQ